MTYSMHKKQWKYVQMIGTFIWICGLNERNIFPFSSFIQFSSYIKTVERAAVYLLCVCFSFDRCCFQNRYLCSGRKFGHVTSRERECYMLSRPHYRIPKSNTLAYKSIRHGDRMRKEWIYVILCNAYLNNAMPYDSSECWLTLDMLTSRKAR